MMVVAKTNSKTAANTCSVVVVMAYMAKDAVKNSSASDDGVGTVGRRVLRVCVQDKGRSRFT